MICLSGCEAGREPGVIATVEGFAGLVAGDEPRAVTVGRDVLGNGGMAADAAVAMYFTMTTTLPSRVGIAGSGVCLVHNSGLIRKDRGIGVEVIEFLPDPANPRRLQMAGPRAMAVLHARHGVLRWEALLGPAEQLSRNGSSVSRAFAKDLASASAFVAANRELREVFANNAGELAGEGDVIEMTELSGLISGLRRQGAGYLYTGAFASPFVEASRASDFPITREDLRQALPLVKQPLTVPVGDSFAYFPPNDGGLLAAQMWAMLTEVETYQGAARAEKAHLLAEAGQRAFSQRRAWFGNDLTVSGATLLSEGHLQRLLDGYSGQQHNRLDIAQGGAALRTVSNPFGAGFVIADSWSNAVACSVIGTF